MHTAWQKWTAAYQTGMQQYWADIRQVCIETLCSPLWAWRGFCILHLVEWTLAQQGGTQLYWADVHQVGIETLCSPDIQQVASGHIVELLCTWMLLALYELRVRHDVE